LGNCQSESNNIRKFNFKQFEPYLHKTNDTVYVVNFWASWCVPCREELPAFEKVREKYSGKKVKILLVSLDFPNQVNSRLLPFIHKNQIRSEIILLDDPNQNQWIDKVDPKWSGALPFTQIYRKDFRESYERSFRFNELDSIINLKL
jgi:thiol-disulfide isomerase/thioredoxin